MKRAIGAVLSFAVAGLLLNASALQRVFERTTPSVLQPVVSRVLTASERAGRVLGADEVRRGGEAIRAVIEGEGVVRNAQGRRYLLVGDSMMTELASAMDQQLREKGASSTSVIRRGSTLGDGIWGWEEDIDDLVKRSQADVVVVLLDANAEDTREYADVVGYFAKEALKAGATQVVWLERPLCDDPVYEEDHSLRHEGLRMADEEVGPLVVIDEGASVMPSSGAYGAWISDSSGKKVRVRRDDGVHLTEAGADILARAVLDRLGV